MRLLEVEAKEVFAQGKIRVPRAQLVTCATDKSIFAPCVVKAQVLSGKRGKRGLVRKAVTKKEAQRLTKQFLGNSDVQSVLIEELVEHDREWYVSVTIDPSTRKLIGMYSTQGGVDIEELSKRDPKAIKKFPLTQLKRFIRNPQLRTLFTKLALIMSQYDAELVEINPLALRGRSFIALDAKMIVDNNAMYKHPEFGHTYVHALTTVEREAAKHHLHYVALDGDIGIIGDGAGLVMATLDVLSFYGGKPADFLDIGGGADEETMYEAMHLLNTKKVKKLFINIFGGITQCDEIARAIVRAKKKLRLKKSLIVRMTGTHAEQGIALLQAAGIPLAKTLDEGVRRIVRC